MTSAARSRISSGLRIEPPQTLRSASTASTAIAYSWRTTSGEAIASVTLACRYRMASAVPSGLGTTRRTTSSRNRSPRLIAG